MKLAYIELTGFRGAKSLLRLEVPTGFLIIAGRNGSGKSTICDAINFAITGGIREHGHKEKGETYADYLWWRGNGSASERFVKLGFQDAHGDIHEVIRTDDGIDTKSEEVLRRLYDHNGAPDRPLHALARTTLLRDEEITSLSVDLPESDRYKFVRDALGTVDLADIDDNLSKLKKRLDERLRGDQKTYDRLRDKISDLTTRLSDLRGSQSSSPDDQAVEQEMKSLLELPDASLTQLLESARKRLVAERKRLDRLHRLSENMQQIALLRETVASKQYTDRRLELEGLVLDLQKQLAKNVQECEKLDSQVEQAKLQEPHRTKHAQLCDLGESIGLAGDNQCPLCGSDVSQQRFDDNIVAVREGIKSASSGLVAMISNQREAVVKRNESKAKLDVAKQQLSEHLARKNELDLLLESAVEESASENITVPKEDLSTELVRAEMEKVRDIIRRIENGVGWLESSSVTEMIQSLESELGDLKVRSNDAYATVTRSEKATSKIKDAQKTTKSLLGEIIDEQLAELSPMIEELYKRLRPHVEWTQIKYRLRGDVRRMLSFEVGDGLNPSFVFSSGQRRAAGLAFLISVHLSRPWCNFESLVLDDPVQHVDDFRALNLTELLTSIRKAGRQIVCCVEDEALGQLMCRRLRSGTDTDGRFIRMQYDCESGITKTDDLEIGPSRQRILVPA